MMLKHRVQIIPLYLYSIKTSYLFKNYYLPILILIDYEPRFGKALGAAPFDLVVALLPPPLPPKLPPPFPLPLSPKGDTAPLPHLSTPSLVPNPNLPATAAVNDGPPLLFVV